jgi:lysophospholipase L1-like esterase
VDNPEDGRAAFRRNLVSFVALARAHGAVPILITQAHRAGEKEAFGGEFLAYNELAREVAAATGTPLVDAAPELSGHPEFFVDDVHMNAAGLAALEARLEPALAAALASRGAP